MSTAIAYVANTNVLTLTGLVSEDDGAPLNSATVTVTIKDAADSSIAGESWPVTMDYVDESEGNYRALISSAAALVAGAKYKAIVDVNASDTSSERIAHWEFPFTAQVRKK